MWTALDQFVTKYDGRIQQAKRPLYLVAMARAEEGNKELAEQLAEKAWHLEPKQPLASFDEARSWAAWGKWIGRYANITWRLTISRSVRNPATTRTAAPVPGCLSANRGG